jgi:phosphate transport system substrate-binding protein
MVDHGGKRHRLIQIIAVIVSTLTVALVWPLECPAAESLVIPGTGDGQELFKALAQAYERIHPGATIGIPPSIDSGGGIRATADGECPIGRVARPPKPKEKRYNLTYRPLARTPLVIAVNPSVTTVRTLSQAQLVGVFSGEIKNWKELGGEDAKIYVVQRESGDSARKVMEERLPGFRGIDRLEGYVAYSADEALKAIADHKDTLGYVSLSGAEEYGLPFISVDGIPPTVENIENDSYPFTSTIGFVWKDELSGLARSFVDFCFGPKGAEVLKKSGAVPLY